MRRDTLDFFTKALVELSLGEDLLLVEERVRGIRQVLREMFAGKKLAGILSKYLAALEKYRVLTNLNIYHCGNLSGKSVDALRSHFENALHRRLRANVYYSEDLIAGIRVVVADIAVECSIAGTLTNYKKSLNSG